MAYDVAVQRAFVLPIAAGAVAFGFSLLVSPFLGDVRGEGVESTSADVGIDGVEERQGEEVDRCWRRLIRFLVHIQWVISVDTYT